MKRGWRVYTFDVVVSDGVTTTSQSTTIHVNTPAVIGGVSSGNVVEDVTTSVSGQLTISDDEPGENVFQVSGTSTTYGSYTIDAGGLWTYTLNNSSPVIQALPAGATLSDSFTVHSFDGTAKLISLTITGTNDAAVIGGVSTGSLVEDVTLSASGALTISDTDSGEASFQAGAAATSYGSYTVDIAGNWVYSLNNANPAVQALPAGATLSDSFTVLAFDGTTKVVNLTITGTNDAAVIGGVSSGSVVEDVTLTASGALTVSDTDSGEASFQSAAATTTYGSYTIDAAGNWVFTLNNANPAVQALPAGATLSDSFTVAEHRRHLAGREPDDHRHERRGRDRRRH